MRLGRSRSQALTASPSGSTRLALEVDALGLCVLVRCIWDALWCVTLAAGEWSARDEVEGREAEPREAKNRGSGSNMKLFTTSP